MTITRRSNGYFHIVFENTYQITIIELSVNKLDEWAHEMIERTDAAKQLKEEIIAFVDEASNETLSKTDIEKLESLRKKIKEGKGEKC